MKATEQYFPLVLFIMMCQVVLTFKSVEEIFKCDHSNENYLAVRMQGGATFESMNEVFKCDHSNESC